MVEPALTGRIVRVYDQYVVIDKGSADGVEPDSRFVIYRLGDEIIDEKTHASLGRLELVCGEGKPANIQEHMATLESARLVFEEEKKVIHHRKENANGIPQPYKTEETFELRQVVVPFDGVDTDCFFKLAPYYAKYGRYEMPDKYGSYTHWDYRKKNEQGD